MAISDQEFALLSKYAYDISGILVDEKKKYLLDYRLNPLAKELECKDLTELYQKSKKDHTHKIQERIIDAITINETSFFRDKNPFELLKYKLLPDNIDHHTDKTGNFRNPIRIWSAGSSTGQEAYSIGFTMRSVMPNAGPEHCHILGTDISDEVVTRSSRGIYSHFETSRGLSSSDLDRHFIQEGKQWRIKDEVRGIVQFRKLNLLAPWGALPIFDIVFCRYVAIYFSVEDQKKLFDRMAGRIRPGGFLITSSGERIDQMCPRFTKCSYHNTICYERTG